MAKYRVGLIGCGPRQNDHVKAFREVAECEIVAVADMVEEARKGFAEKHNIQKTYASAKEMIQDSKIDIVTVVTRPLWMKEPVLESIQAGVRGILVEKPFGVNIEEANEMLDSAESAKTALLVNHQYRFFDIAERMREIIISGELGDVEFFRSISAIKLHGQGTHMIDFIRFLYDDRPFVWALGNFAGKDSFDAKQIGPDYNNGVVMFDNGVPLYIEAGQGSMQAPYLGNNLNLYADAVCTKGRIWFGLSHGLRIWRNDGQYEEIPCQWPQMSDPAQVRLVESLINTIETGEIGRSDARKSYATQEALCALLESAITHQKVKFPLNIPPNLMERVRQA